MVNAEKMVLEVSSHSFHQGGATCAIRAKLPDSLLQCQGDLISNAYKRYLEMDLAHSRQEGGRFWDTQTGRVCKQAVTSQYGSVWCKSRLQSSSV